jgi:hypothetical protein
VLQHGSFFSLIIQFPTYACNIRVKTKERNLCIGCINFMYGGA